MKAITIKLPWAAAIAAGAKLVENRGRPVRPQYIGERVAIHAGAGWSKEGAADPRVRQWWCGPGRTPPALLDATDFSFYFRRILAMATVADCHIADQCCRPWGDAMYGDKRAWHIVLADVERVWLRGSVRGSLSVPWTLPEDVADAIAIEVAS